MGGREWRQVELADGLEEGWGQPWLGIVLAGLAVFGFGTVLGAEPPQHLASFGPDGTAVTNFETVAPVAVDQESGAVYVGDIGKQILYRFGADGKPLKYDGLSGSELGGLSFNDQGRSQAAVDADTHVIYVTGKAVVEAFDADGNPHLFTAGPGVGTNELPGASELGGVAVDSVEYLRQ